MKTGQSQRPQAAHTRPPRPCSCLGPDHPWARGMRSYSAPSIGQGYAQLFGHPAVFSQSPSQASCWKPGILSALFPEKIRSIWQTSFFKLMLVSSLFPISRKPASIHHWFYYFPPLRQSWTLLKREYLNILVQLSISEERAHGGRRKVS